MKRYAPWLAAAPCLAAALVFAQGQPPRKVGYTDTPMLPGGKWHVHDGNRPQPKVVTPPPYQPAPAPADAIVLFDGKDTSQWTNDTWKVVGDAMVVGKGDTRTKESFLDFQLHIEWATPSEVKGIDQGRGNSGIFLCDRYEIQVLDNWDNITYPDGQAGAIYAQTPPLVNACRKPGEWQTYDILFTAPRFDDQGQRIAAGHVTVIHNGIVVQNNTELLGVSSHRVLPRQVKHGAAPIRLQDHGNPTRFRNIWIRPIPDRD